MTLLKRLKGSVGKCGREPSFHGFELYSFDETTARALILMLQTDIISGTDTLFTFRVAQYETLSIVGETTADSPSDRWRRASL